MWKVWFVGHLCLWKDFLMLLFFVNFCFRLSVCWNEIGIEEHDERWREPGVCTSVEYARGRVEISCMGYRLLFGVLVLEQRPIGTLLCYLCLWNYHSRQRELKGWRLWWQVLFHGIIGRRQWWDGLERRWERKLEAPTKSLEFKLEQQPRYLAFHTLGYNMLRCHHKLWFSLWLYSFPTPAVCKYSVSYSSGHITELPRILYACCLFVSFNDPCLSLVK